MSKRSWMLWRIGPESGLKHSLNLCGAGKSAVFTEHLGDNKKYVRDPADLPPMLALLCVCVPQECAWSETNQSAKEKKIIENKTRHKNILRTWPGSLLAPPKAAAA